MSEKTSIHGRWQYMVKIIKIAEPERLRAGEPYSLDGIADSLDAWGAQGWELVNVIPSLNWLKGDYGVSEMVEAYAFFKRRL
ncbi:MAG: hypothetical protein ACK2UQ_12300 [Anaerolineae bacterium]|jgi:hypothetical protein